MSATHLTIKRWFRAVLDEDNRKYLGYMGVISKKIKKRINETQGQKFILDMQYPKKIFYGRKSFISINVYLYQTDDSSLLQDIEKILDDQKFISFVKNKKVANI